jgi:hypothetical protein
VAGLILSGPATLKAGESGLVQTAAVDWNGKPGPAPAGVLYASSNTVTASVYENGMVTSHSPGSTVISAVYGGRVATHILTVLAGEDGPGGGGPGEPPADKTGPVWPIGAVLQFPADGIVEHAVRLEWPAAAVVPI